MQRVNVLRTGRQHGIRWQRSQCTVLFCLFFYDYFWKIRWLGKPKWLHDCLILFSVYNSGFGMYNHRRFRLNWMNWWNVANRKMPSNATMALSAKMQFPLNQPMGEVNPSNCWWKFCFSFLRLRFGSTVFAPFPPQMLLLHDCHWAFTLKSLSGYFCCHQQWRLVTAIHYVRKLLVFELLPPL